MTIQEALYGYDNGKLVMDKLVCQFPSPNGSRVVFRFTLDSEGLYLRKDEIFGFGRATQEEFQLSDQDVNQSLLEYVIGFWQNERKVYDIFKREVPVPAAELLSGQALAAFGLEDKAFFISQS
jgi:hypothetical protein